MNRGAIKDALTVEIEWQDSVMNDGTHRLLGRTANLNVEIIPDTSVTAMSVSRHDLIACACGKHPYPKPRIPDNVDKQTMCDLELNFLSRDVPMRTWSRRT